MLSAQRELDGWLDRRSSVFAGALDEMLRTLTPYNLADHEEAVARLAEIIRNSMILTDLHGRKRVLMEADLARRQRRIARFAADNAISPLPFEEAVEDIVSREPRLARSAEEVSRLYNTQRVFAMARSADIHLTKRVQEIVRELADKATPAETEAEIMAAAREAGHDWTRAYAGVVYRTNVSSAYNHGRFQQATDDDVRKVTPSFEFVGVDDARTRDNHRARFGLIAPVLSPEWDRHSPPLGYNCRCSLRLVSKFELERRGLIDRQGNVGTYIPRSAATASADAGFEYRPARRWAIAGAV